MKGFVLTAYDGEDSFERRMSSRQAHIDYIDQLRAAGKALMGAALTDENDKMIGSVLILNMNEAELEEYMKTEPYITNSVWDKVYVQNCAVGPSFLK
jgi:uncharacterized protein YciI